jgi:ABC-2 type transport system ATP-binding protein
VIALRGAWKRFGARTAVEPLHLGVAAGEVVALVGPNGAGKSTVLRILAGTIRPSGGGATISGRDVVAEGAEARRVLGYLPQRLGVPSTTVLRDLTALVAAVRAVPLAEALVRLADVGLADRLGATLAQLSGGQRQRAMLALAALGRVEALLLDEPSISLDTEGAEEVRAEIRRARSRGTAVLFASHHLHDVARLADRIAVMVDGRVAAQGTLADLASAAGVPWSEVTTEAPIERIYRILVGRQRTGSVIRDLTLLRGDAA